jgi:hypothetical protein
MNIAIPEKATAAIMSTMSEEAPIEQLCLYEYRNYGLISGMRIINGPDAKYQFCQFFLTI